jgi:hypothetical protein
VALVIDTASGKTLATLPVGKDADAVLLDEARGLAFIPCGGSGIALSIADANHVSITQVIPTQVGAKTGAVDPAMGASICLPPRWARTRRQTRQAPARHLHHSYRRA